MKTFYVASSLRNIKAVRYVCEELRRNGLSQTYDWTQNAEATKALRFTLEDLRAIGEKEKQGVLGADVVIVLLPGGKGTHVELGIALGLGKRIVLYSTDEIFNKLDDTSTFYHLPEVTKCCGTLEELLTKIVA